MLLRLWRRRGADEKFRISRINQSIDQWMDQF
jgi:hypothetical protein